MTAINLLACNLPGGTPLLSRVSGVIVLGIWASLYRPLKADRSLNTSLGLAGILLSFFLLVNTSAFAPGTALILFILLVQSKGSKNKKKELQVCLITIFLYSTYLILEQYSPYPWYLQQKISLVYSVAVTSAVHNPMTLGQSAVGIPVTVSMICFGSGLAHFRRKPLFFASALSLPIVANILFLWLQKPLLNLVHLYERAWQPTPLDFQVILLFLSLILFYPLIQQIDKTGENEPGGSADPIAVRAGLAVIVGLLAFSAVFFLAFNRDGIKSKGEIIFCDKGANWSVPRYGKKYGQKSVGMFGMLPHYLEMRGYHARVEKNDLSPLILKKAAAVVVFNPSKYFSGEERRLLRDFVKQGGGLLVAGDHTDVTGLMGPINDILAPFNIGLNFDTALPISSGWINSLEKRPHPITRGLDNDYDAGIWVGASLDIDLPASPVIVGKRGWADLGDYRNKKRAYLGDYKRSEKEQLADVVLVAESEYGKGRVLVFADTSPFQNAILTHTHPFLDTIFTWLVSGKGAIHFPQVQFGLSIIFIAAALAIIIRTPCILFFVVFVLAAHGGVWFSQTRLVSNVETESSSFSKAQYEPAFIDFSHMERFAPLASSDYSTWGLTVNLMRNAFIPLYLKEISTEALSASRLFFVIAPTKAFSKKEIKILKAYMENGGFVIWTVGWEDMEASKNFLDEFNLSLDAVPLGSTGRESGKRGVSFLEAWPIICKNGTGDVLAGKWDYPVIVFQPRGKGGLLLIGDSQFLLSKNMESYKKFKYNNIRFFRQLLVRLGQYRKQGMAKGKQ
ncbi:MAG: hypothetical protein GY737_25590 [Desulfobacteraceae bacterium]|nr:hypothetical protein [Desulfobacteraceae bacterium]